MTLSSWFWILYVLSLLFGFYVEYIPGQAYPYPRGVRHFLFYALIGLLGYAVFQGPLKH